VLHAGDHFSLNRGENQSCVFALMLRLACQAAAMAKNGNRARNRLSKDPITITSMSTSRKPRIGITLGDCAGIGPEIVDLALKSDQVARSAECKILGKYPRCPPGQPTKETARAAAAALEEAVTLARRGKLDAIVTGPVHKARMYAVGFKFPGQTEFFAERCSVKNFAMCLTGGKMTIALVTAHLPLRKVARALKQSEIVRVGLLLANFLRSRAISAPRIAVAGLNPHAGESGKLGDEEIEIIAPAIAKLNGSPITDQRSLFSGPHSPDTVFHRAIEGDFDAVLCMYHDQGLIPLKLHAFHEGVNVTLGLPFPRTSPDHGTAFEIAGKGIARPDSMIAAINLAAELTARSS
jgi:4-hydroxythreonine-4-phosphate dehydrogenase